MNTDAGTHGVASCPVEDKVAKGISSQTGRCSRDVQLVAISVRDAVSRHGPIPRAPVDGQEMTQFGVVLKSMSGKRAGILVLLDELDEALEIAAELLTKGIEVEVKRMVKRAVSTPVERQVVATSEAPVLA